MSREKRNPGGGGGDPCELHQSLTDGPDGGLRAIGNTDLAQDVLDVFLDRLVADVQCLSDFFVGQSECQLAQHFALALGERHFDVGVQPRGRQRRR